MAKLSKDVYDAKAEWAAQKMLKNAECESLTKEQHDVLAWMCSVRHETHCNQDAFWNCEDASHKRFWDYITNFCDIGEIEKRLMEVGLPVIEWSFDYENYMTDGQCYEFEYSDDEMEEEHERCLEMAEKFNNDIESYLSQIDKEHGTSYCPSGLTRIY